MIAEGQPAQLPLPGGRAGATIRLHPLMTGEMPGPPEWFERENEGRLAVLYAYGLLGDRSEYMRIPVPAFLVEHPGVGAMLIDTGLHPSVAVDPKQSFGRVLAFYYRGIKMDSEQAAAAQLRARGLDAADIRYVLMTHMHVDHASAISDFPDATFVLSKQEWDAISEGKDRGYVERQYDYGFDYRTFDFESPATESFTSFGRSFDLFGDGSVRAVFTPGHTHGHTSYVLRLRDREVLVAADAAYTRRTLDEGVLPFKMADEHQFRRSLREIQRYREQTPGALIVPGHDWDSFSALDPVYE